MFGMLRSTLNNHVIPTLSMVKIESSCMKFWYVEVGRCAHLRSTSLCRHVEFVPERFFISVIVICSQAKESLSDEFHFQNDVQFFHDNLVIARFMVRFRCH